MLRSTRSHKETIGLSKIAMGYRAIAWAIEQGVGSDYLGHTCGPGGGDGSWGVGKAREGFM